MQRIKGGWWLALVWVLGGFTAGAHAQDLESGLVAHYAFDGNLSDDGPNGYNGRTVGGPAFTRGLLGQALRFDGIDDLAEFTGIPASTFNGSFTAGWFMQVDALERYSLLSKRGSCTVGDHFDVQLGDDTPERIGFNLSRTGQVGITTARAVAEEGPWIHVAIVRDASSARVYVDGRGGASINVGTLNLSGVTAALAFGGSPCIGRSGGPVHYRGLLDELRVYNRALTGAEVSGLSRVTALTANPGAATSGARITVAMSNLEAGRTYELRLRQGRSVNQLLATLSNVSGSESRSITVPAVAAGEYEIALVQRPLFAFLNGIVVRTAPFSVVGGLSFSNITSQPQAGKRMQVTVGNLGPGSLRLRYNGRIVAGPTPVDTPTQVLRFLAPADIPATFPATVTLQAELLSGRMIARSGTTTINVRAPFTGPFTTITGITNSNPTPRPRDPLRVTGQLGLADGTTPADVDVSAYWVGDNGRVTPLPTSALAIGANGQFVLDTHPASLGAMTAFVPSGPGRVRIVSNRRNPETGRREYRVIDGGLLTTLLNSDQPTEIRITVRARVGNNTFTPLQGAYAVLDASAPVQEVQPPPPSGGQSSTSTGGAALLANRQPAFSMAGANGLIVANQLDPATFNLAPPLPECGTSLFRRYTNAQGRTEFPIEGEVEGTPGSWQGLMSTNLTPAACSGVSCNTTIATPIAEFFLTVYTLHLGAGYRTDTNSNAEIPSRYRIRYDRDNLSFEIRDERTGVTTTQQNAVNLIVDVPAITQLGGFVTISDPLVFQTVGTDFHLVPRQGSTGYGRWVDFQGAAGVFVHEQPPRRHIRFAHRPDAGGSLVSAKLFLPNLITGAPALIGDFVRISNVAGCNIQDDPSVAGSETWELLIDGPLSRSWRTPRGVLFRNDAVQTKACGFIQVTNTLGGSGRRNICFEWQALPESLTQSAGSMLIDDSNVNDVKFERSGQELNDADTSLTLPATINGEPIRQPRTRDNRTRTSRSTFDRITATGPASAARQFAGVNPKQFAQAAGGRSANGNLGGSNFVEIGNDEYQSILDETIPLFSWTWGVPELFGAQVYADLRLLADYYFYGRLQQINSDERLDMTTDARFGININVGVDIDVLFGLFFDAGAYITGYALSTMPTVVTNNQVTQSGPCFYFGMTFTGYFDPCSLCPTPVIEDTFPIISARTPNSCAHFDGAGRSEPLLTASKGNLGVSPVTGLEQRQLRRHPAISFGNDGNGHMLMLDAAETLRVSAIENGTPRAGATLSSAPNARQAQIVHYAPDRAVAVWAESALPPGAVATADVATLARNQRIAYSLYNGAGWSGKKFLTAPGMGEAFPALAACNAGRAGCPGSGAVTAVWQRNLSGDYLDPVNRIQYSQFTPGAGWSAVAEVSTVASGVQDITPTVSYLGEFPLVVWVRQQGSDRNDFTRRSLAYRIVGRGNAQVASALPSGAIAPTLRAHSASSATLAFTKVDADTGPIGTRQALHMATATCSAGTCAWTWRRPTDPFGRAIYGERPQLVAGGDGDTSIVMRAFQFRGTDGGPVQQGDPFGTVVSSGDLLNIRVNPASGMARTIAISADGASHFGATAAFNPISEEIVTLAATYAPSSLLSVASAMKAAGYDTQVAYGKAVANVGGVEMRALPATPDLVVELVTTNASSVAPGAPIQATVRIGNRGSVYDTARDGIARVELRWNLATGTGAPLAAANITSLAGGDGRDLVLGFNAPADAFADEAHTLYAVIVPSEDLIELSGDNNIGTREFDGLPVPFDLASFSTPGYAPVQLGWTAAADPRVIGYRVYRREGSEWMPLGSSPGTGFLDLSTQFGVSRTYAVTSYSIRGVESPLSEVVHAMPSLAERTEDELFGDGFESATP